MSRILLVSNYAWTIYNFRRNLIRELQDVGHEVFVQTEFDGYENRLGLAGSRVFPLDIDRKGVNPVRDVRTIFSIFRCIEAAKADLCLFFTIKPVVYGGIAAKFRSVPFVSNITGLGAAFQGRSWLRAVAKILYSTGLARAARVFFQNKEDMHLFVSEGIVKSASAALVPGSGVDLSRFSPAPYPTNPSPIFILIARLLRDKGVWEFVEAARMLKVRHPNARFRVLGPTGVVNPSAICRGQMEAWVAKGAVEYLGETDDVVPHIAAADCVVLPSYYGEGVPRTLLEAAAMARPTITTDHAGCRDAVEDGITGLLCKVRDSSSLAQAMERLISMPRSRRAEMGRKGRAKIEREFDERFVISSYLGAIDEVVAERDLGKHA